MAPSIEDILLARAQQKEEERLSPETAAIIGAGLGSALGVTGGHVVHKGGNFLNKIKDGLAAGQGLTRNGLEAVTRTPGHVLRGA